MLQDECQDLSRWLATRPGARRQAKEAAMLLMTLPAADVARRPGYETDEGDLREAERKLAEHLNAPNVEVEALAEGKSPRTTV